MSTPKRFARISDPGPRSELWVNVEHVSRLHHDGQSTVLTFSDGREVKIAAELLDVVKQLHNPSY